MMLKSRGLGRQHEAYRQVADVLKSGGIVVVVDPHIKRFEHRMLRDFDLLVICEQIIETNPLRILSGRIREFKNHYNVKIIA